MGWSSVTMKRMFGEVGVARATPASHPITTAPASRHTAAPIDAVAAGLFILRSTRAMVVLFPRFRARSRLRSRHVEALHGEVSVVGVPAHAIGARVVQAQPE